MSTRLQVVLEEQELDEIRVAAAREGLTVSEWVRQSLRRARRATGGGDSARKLAVIRAAAGHAFPTADVDRMLAEIESGYLRGPGG
jgi:hypothetical protein